MPETLMELKGQRAETLHQMQLLMEKAKNESRELDETEREQYDKMTSRFDRLSDMIGLVGKSAEYEREAQANADKIELDAKASGNLSTVDIDKFTQFLLGETPERELVIPYTAFQNLGQGIRRQYDNADEAYKFVTKFALSEGTDSAGGYTVQDMVAREIVWRMTTVNAIERTNSPVLNTPDTTNLAYPVSDDISNQASRVNENTTPTAATDPVFASVDLNTFGYSTGVLLMSEQLIRNSGVMVVSEVAGALGSRAGRKLEGDGTNGDGSGDPMGIVTALNKTNTKVNLTAAAATAVGSTHFAGLVEAQKYIDQAYLSRAVYMMHPNLWYSLQTVTLGSADARRLINMNYADGVPMRFGGLPVILNTSMQSSFTNATNDDGDVVALCGTFEHFRRRYAGPFMIRRIDQDADYIQKRQIGIIGFVDFGCNWVHPAISSAVSASNQVPIVAIAANTA